MSNLRNRVQLVGHLGADPEVKKFENTTLTSIRLATNESYKSQSGEWVDQTTWHRVTLWGALADSAMQQLHKGSFVMIEGKLTNREYINAQGDKKYFTEVRANSFILLDKRPKNDQPTLQDATPTMMQEAEDDGLPF